MLVHHPVGVHSQLTIMQTIGQVIYVQKKIIRGPKWSPRAHYSWQMSHLTYSPLLQRYVYYD